MAGWIQDSLSIKKTKIKFEINFLIIKGRIIYLQYTLKSNNSYSFNKCPLSILQIIEKLVSSPVVVLDFNNLYDMKYLVKLIKLDFLKEIKDIKGEIKDQIRRRIKEFEDIRKNEISIFNELCYCILTANCKAKDAIKIQKIIGYGFINFREYDLIKELKKLGYRYPKIRARYILDARKFYGSLNNILNTSDNILEFREWLANNIKGLGFKEASHFLRNIGYNDVSIIDRHILRFLKKKELIEEIPKNLSKNKYLEFEKILTFIANSINLSPGELDLYLWYFITGKILK
jgi:N-glycosylase/DNA lyase